MNKANYKYCVIFGVDGMGNFNKDAANTPAMDSFVEEGASTFYAQSMDPTISAENWGAMLIGTAPLVHGLTNSIVGKYPYTDKSFPTVFSRLRSAYPDSTLVSCCNWNPINIGIVEDGIGVEKYTADNDKLLTPIILENVKKKPKLLFIQFDNVDGAGHGNGYGTEKHIEQIEITDGYISSIIDAYKTEGIYDETLFICLADHGGVRRGHGGTTPTEKNIFFAVKGKGITKNEIPEAKAVDIAATVLYALGLDVPEYTKGGFTSQVPDGVFNDYSRKYFVPPVKEVKIDVRETPDINSEKGLYAFVNKDKLKMALFFDNEIKDETGKCTFTEEGTIKYYSNGIYSSRGEFGLTGHAVAKGLDIGKGSFSIAVWLYANRGLNEECLIMANKGWKRGMWGDKGLALMFTSYTTKFQISYGEDDFDIITPYPDGFKEGWIHLIVTVDAENKKLSVYNNFEEVHTAKTDNDFVFDAAAGDFYIGDCAIGSNREIFPNIFNMDDLLVFDGVLTDDEIKKLEKYYDIPTA